MIASEPDIDILNAVIRYCVIQSISFDMILVNFYAPATPSSALMLQKFSIATQLNLTYHESETLISERQPNDERLTSG
jgi:hypothetical protein